MATTTKKTITDTTTSADPADALARIRGEIAATHTEIAAVAHAPLPLDEALAALHGNLDNLAARYWKRASQVLAGFARGSGDVRNAVPRFDDPDAPACWIALGGDAVRREFEERLRQAYDADPTLAAAAVPAADRPARVAQLRAKLQELELQEELVIVRAQRRGMRLERRADVESIALLFDPAVLVDEGLAAGILPSEATAPVS